MGKNARNLQPGRNRKGGGMRWDEGVAKNEKACAMTLRFGDGGRSLGNKFPGVA